MTQQADQASLVGHRSQSLTQRWEQELPFSLFFWCLNFTTTNSVLSRRSDLISFVGGLCLLRNLRCRRQICFVISGVSGSLHSHDCMVQKHEQVNRMVNFAGTD